MFRSLEINQRSIGAALRPSVGMLVVPSREPDCDAGYEIPFGTPISNAEAAP